MPTTISLCFLNYHTLQFHPLPINSSFQGWKHTWKDTSSNQKPWKGYNSGTSDKVKRSAWVISSVIQSMAEMCHSIRGLCQRQHVANPTMMTGRLTWAKAQTSWLYYMWPAVKFTSYQNWMLRTADQTRQHFLDTTTYTLIQTYVDLTIYINFQRSYLQWIKPAS